jgi:hypothetical protein
MNTDILTLYAPQLLAGITGVAVLLFGANIGQAITAIVRKHDIEDLDEANRSIVAELTEERVKREQADVLNERMGDEQIEYLLNMKKLRQQLYDAEAERDHAISMYEKCLEDVNTWKGDYVRAENEALKWKKTAKEVEADRDIAHAEAMQFTADLNTLQAERATLYRRNALGRIEPITPKPRKPHTLRHGMTVNNPSVYQAKRIFAEAKKAGIDWDTADNMEGMSPTADIIFWSYGWNGEKNGCVVNRPESYPPATYISAREFRRRIKGEIE